MVGVHFLRSVITLYMWDLYTSTFQLTMLKMVACLFLEYIIMFLISCVLSLCPMAPFPLWVATQGLTNA